MAVAFESIGYPDTIAPGAAWAKAITLAGGGRYGVAGAGDWKVTRKPGADRTLVIAPGTGWGEGVVDVTALADEVVCGTVAAGSTRYDMIVARRTWGATNETQFAVVPGSSVKALPARSATPGDVDEQPLALVPVVGNSGGGVLGDVIDLRVWQQNGGAYAVDDLVRSYLDGVGTTVRIGGDQWQRTIDTLSNPTWTKTPQIAPVNLFGAGSALSPGPMPAGAFPLIQAGTTVNETDAAGYARITFPTPFPNGLLTILLMDGDTSVDRAVGEILHYGVAGLPWGTGQRTDVVYAVMRPRASWSNLNTGSLRHRVNWLAIGW